jgi:hypothetical protein
MNFYNTKIQLHKKVIEHIFQQLKPGMKLLVFGLGYDSEMWYHATNKNTFFVENNEVYCKMNEKTINKKHIIKHNYDNITVAKSFALTLEQIKKYEMPSELKKNGPFDIILIDGPGGYNSSQPGRLLPCFWSTLLIKPHGNIYVDDSSRALEKHCINLFFSKYTKVFLEERLGTCVITFNDAKSLSTPTLPSHAPSSPAP